MDSGSGSMQSSSGGDEEYDDSRAESISAFLNPSNYVSSMANYQQNQLPPPPPPPPPPPSQQQSHYLQIQSSSPTMFDPLTNYFDSLSSRSSPNSLLNLDTVWYKNMRSDPNCTDVGGFMSTSVTNQQPPQQSLQNRGGYPPYGQQQMMEALHGGGGGVADKISAANIEMGNNNNNTQNNNMGVRNPKKRSRASRRAPTTVLTTDTSSFRAMVQEFTGIPAPPFTSSSSLFPRTRFDFFASPSPPSTSFRPLLHPSHPPYLLRPFPQKLHPPIIAPTTTTTTNPFSSSSSSTTSFIDSMNQLHPHQPLTNQNFNNPLNNSTLNPLPPYKMGILEEFGLTRSVSDNPTNTTNWCGSGSGSKVIQEEEEKEREDGLRPVVRSYNSNNGKSIYSDSSAQGGGGFHGENVTASGARTEGMVESWIGSSD